jgi:hypothetical protein
MRPAGAGGTSLASSGTASGTTSSRVRAMPTAPFTVWDTALTYDLSLHWHSAALLPVWNETDWRVPRREACETSDWHAHSRAAAYKATEPSPLYQPTFGCLIGFAVGSAVCLLKLAHCQVYCRATTHPHSVCSIWQQPIQSSWWRA